MSPPPSVGARLDHLDHLRAGLVVLVVALHAAVPYMVHAPAWRVQDPARSIFFDGLALVAEALAVPGLLFVAGWCVPASLLRRGPAGFARERLRRLGLPFLVALAALGPLPSYFEALGSGAAPPYLEHAGDFFRRWDLDHGHLWFLPFLLALSLAVAAAGAPLSRALAAARREPPGGPSARHLAFATLGFGLPMALSRQLAPDSRWIDTVLLNVQPSHLALNVGCFALGMLAWARRWGDAPARPGPWLVASALGLAYLGAHAAWPGADGPLPNLVTSLLHGGFAAAGLLALSSARPGFVAWGGRWRAFTRHGLGIYLLHYPAVLGLGLALSRANAPPGLKFALAFGGSLAAAGLVSAAPWTLGRLVSKADADREA